MNKLFPILGLAAGGLLLLGNKKTASAAVKPPGANTANPTAKQKTKAEWTAIIAHSLKNDSYNDYVKVLTEAYKTGLFTQAEISAYQKKHKNFPKASSGSATAAKPSSDLDKRIATALATNNPEVIRALANALEKEGGPANTIADLRKVASALEASLKEGQDRGQEQTPVQPPVAPKKPKIPSPKPAPVQTVSKAEVAAATQEFPPLSPTASRELAIEVAKHLTTAKKGKEDKALIERYQRNQNRIALSKGFETGGLNPDGRYGSSTAYTLAEYDLVPPKPLYWGKANDYASFVADKKQWKAWCLAAAQKDPARKAEWTGASKV